MFKKILIANRGEIACRVIKTARRMGIATVAVYSDADADALHVEMADEKIHIGPPPAAQSYLVIDKIVEAARTSGAEAVHPGYGFLSERAAFAEALEKAGIAFIGPKPHAIRAMGDKIESKKLAKAANVSTVPGYLGEIENVDDAKRIAHEIGYPVMIKASAGGGGKGMRVAHDDASLIEGFTSARNEARSAFGDDRVFIEKFALEPRHIEIQILADSHGNAVYLFERECSIQRRHQKVIEEAPSPFLDAKTRAAMGEQAVALAKAVQYQSAGTVEFIVDKDRNFYFLEMNTRLQVEHPVTELITGIDLVEQMIRIAAGEKLSFTQKDLSIKGWAMESRIYAEDPFRNFMPSTGRLTRYRPPAEGRVGDLTLRNDTGVYEGAEISVYYDPMIAKLCTHASTREAAIDHAVHALDEFEIAGIQHNVPFLAALLDHKRFRSGKITTGFIAEEFPDGFHGAEIPQAAQQALIAVAAFLEVREIDRAQTISGQLPGRGRKIRRDWVVNATPVEIEWTDHTATVTIDGHAFAVSAKWEPGQTLFRGEVNAKPYSVQIRRVGESWRLTHRGATLALAVRAPHAAALAALMPEKTAPDLSKYLLCPMPGLVVSIPVTVGQEIKTGETLAVVEAMKMENVLKAERDGTIAKINAKQGDSLAVDAVILEFA